MLEAESLKKRLGGVTTSWRWRGMKADSSHYRLLLIHRVGDVNVVSEVSSLSDGQDLVISAIRPPKGDERLLVSATRSILAGLIRDTSSPSNIGRCRQFTRARYRK